MTTKAVEVKLALEALLAGMPLVTTDNVEVTYGYPTRDPKKLWAAVGKITWESTTWVTNKSREEIFTVAVAFMVEKASSDSKETEGYALALASAFEIAVKADPRIGALCVTTGFVPQDLSSWPVPGGYEAQFITGVRAVCRT